MKPPAKIQIHASAAEVVLGVILGAMLTFGIQVYLHHVEDKRIAREARAKHLERLMTASSAVQASAGSFIFILMEAAAKARAGDGSNFDFQKMMPNMTALTELRTVSSLYVPEIEPEAVRVVQVFQKTYLDLGKTMLPKLMTYKAGDSTLELDRRAFDELTQAAGDLERKLVNLAKENR